MPDCQSIQQSGILAAAMSDGWDLPTVERASTLEQVHRTLRDAIVHGSIAQGTHLREISLAGALGTSRATVREAIRQLVQEGLVEYVLHRGNFVRALSPLDRLDVYVAREAIEVGVVTRVLQTEDGVDLTGLEAAMEELRRRARGRARPDEHVIAADLAFHQELVGLAGSPRLDRAFETLAAETRMLLRLHPRYPWQNYVREHEVILEALRRRDPQAAALVAEHLRLSARLIREGISRDGDQAAMPATAGRGA
jgi:DNA-binding GntR family transcriptional regulator